SVAIGDLNGDGPPDLAVANRDSKSVSVLLGNGDGTFAAAASFAVGTSPQSVAIADLSDDGRLDLAVANAGSHNVSVLLGIGDGRPDLAVGSLGSDDISVLLGKGDGTFGTAASFAAGHLPGSVAIGDLNDDGSLDVAAAGPGLSVLLGNGDGTLRPYVGYGA